MSCVSPFSRGVIFTRPRVSLALSTIPEEKWWTTCTKAIRRVWFSGAHEEYGPSSRWDHRHYCVTFRKCKDFYGRKHSCFYSLRMWKDLTTFVYFFFPAWFPSLFMAIWSIMGFIETRVLKLATLLTTKTWKCLNFAFYGVRKQATTKFSLSFWTWILLACENNRFNQSINQ